MKEVASIFKMGPDQSQIAVISYSDDAQIDVKFGEYSNVNDFNAAVDNVKHQRRRTRIDLALDLAVSSLFTPEGGARPNVAKVMIILTDGRQTNMSGSKSLDVAVRPLQKINVTIVAVGVGYAIDINELLHLVGDNAENLFRARNFNALARDSLRLASRICKTIKPPIGEKTVNCYSVPLLTTAILIGQFRVTFCVKTSLREKSFYANQTHFYMKGFAQRLVLKQGNGMVA